MLEPELVMYQGFTACGVSVETSNALEASPATARVPALWQRFYADALPARLSANRFNGRVVGVYSSYENANLAGYRVTAAVQLVRDHTVAAGMQRVVVSPGEYLRFTAYGTGPMAVVDTWGKIWEFFSHGHHPLAGRFERAYTADFERYGDPDTFTVFIAVKRKLGVHVTAERPSGMLRKL